MNINTNSEVDPMKKHTVGIEGFGDSCARSHNIVCKVGDGVVDPEMEFEAELLSALERADVVAGQTR